MSGIVLSASVRQNLLSLQSTAALLATTQDDLSTGNRVNTALDNPTNYFTAQSLNNRAGDIGNLLDGVGNGVQVLQAANTGLTSLQSLVSSAQSIATQALQTSIGYSTKSNVTANISGATDSDLRGTTTFISAIASSNVLYSGAAGGTTAGATGNLIGGIGGSIAFAALSNNDTTPVAISGTTVLAATTGAASNALSGTDALLVGKTLTVNGHTITFSATAAPATTGVASGSGLIGSVVTDGSGNSTIYLGASPTTSTATIADVENAIDLASGVKTTTDTAGTAVLATTANTTASSVSAAGELTISSAPGSTTSIVGSNDILNLFGLTNATGSTNGTVTVGSSTSSATTANLVQAGSTLNVDGKTISFVSGKVPAGSSLATGSGATGNIVTDGSGNSTVYLQGATITDTLNAIDIATGTKSAAINTTTGVASLTVATGATASTVAANGSLQISTGTSADLAITGTALAALGLGGNQGTATAFNAGRTSGVGGINGKTLTFSAFNGGTPVSVTFGDGTNGTVKSLVDLNTALQADNLNATLSASGNLMIAAGNDYASSTLGSVVAGGAIGGTLTASLTFTTATAPIPDPVAQATRAGLVTQYNNVLAQINTTSQDSSFNGVNLLNGDQLKLVFNETGTSTLNIAGVTFNAAGLGLSNLVQGTSFIDNNATNGVLTNLTSASNTLRAEASALGSNLSIVQIRQDFSKSLIQVLQTGASNLTLADTNQEAANSQALSTRQSIAVSALALANTSQQSVLQLLR
jgi:flagellin